MMQRHDLQLFADYHQFYLQDDDSKFGDLSEAWTGEATKRLLAAAPHVVGVGTVRNVEVPVTIEVHDSRPPIDLSTWDQVNLASLQVDTGRVAVAGCTDYLPDALRIKVTPGAYEVLVCYSGLGSISGDGLEGNDRYWIALYPGKLQAVSVLKERADG
jgi:hypothetical protein